MISRYYKVLSTVVLGVCILCLGSNVFASNFTKLLRQGATLNYMGNSFSTTGELSDKITFSFVGKYPDVQIVVKSSNKKVKPLVLPYTENDSMIPSRLLISVIKDNETGKRFWIIRTEEGNKVINHGFWIVGEYKGQYVTYVSENSFSIMGWKRTDNVPSRSRAFLDNGTLNVSFNNVLVDMNLPGYKTWTNMSPLFFRLDWDKEANWFSITSVTDKYTLQDLSNKNYQRL